MVDIKNNTLFIFTGTSGSGRKTIAKQVGDDLGLVKIISYTTRAPRPHDVNGKDYHFISLEEFKEADKNDEFFQTVSINEKFYAVKTKDLNDAINSGRSAYLVLNRYGSNRLKFEFGDKAVRLFIYVNKQTVKERLESNGASDEVISKYLNNYTEEVTYRKDCEHVFENFDLAETIANVKKAVELNLIS